jgi:hypothetical protein
MRSATFTLSILAFCFASIATAQPTNWYYDQSTRYGTFRHYSNGGSKLITTFRGQRDYAAEAAETQRRVEESAAERKRQRQLELDRMRKAQYPASQPSNTTRNPPPTTYNPSPEEIARRQKEKDDAQYQEYEKKLETAESVSHQGLLLNFMYHLKPNDEIAMRLIAINAQEGNVGGIEYHWKKFSEASRSIYGEAVDAAFSSAYFRNGRYESALFNLDRLKTNDLNSFSESLYCRLQLGKWEELKTSFAKNIAAFPQLSPVAHHLSDGFTALQAGVTDTSKTAVTAAALYQFAVARRESHVMDVANILALDVAVRLAPANATYREERFNANAVLNFKVAMEEDYQFFNK